MCRAWFRDDGAVTDDSGLSPAALLRAYDEQLRTTAEVHGASTVSREGPLWLATYPGGRGFITYAGGAQGLAGVAGPALCDLVRRSLTHFCADKSIEGVEWKTRGHDEVPGLHEALLDAGFIAAEPESIMVGEARRLDVDVPLPTGVTLRRITQEGDVRAMLAMQAEVFGDGAARAEGMACELLDRLAHGDDGLQLWVAEADGRIVSAGRLDPVAGTDFAGIWGGATRPEWRGRGIYRALTAVRARAAIAMGLRLIHSDSTEFSRSILKRSGLVKVSTTTPYEWTRGELG